MEIEVDPGNREQAEAWNGDEGRGWASRRPIATRRARAYVPHLLEGAQLTTTDVVLDVGCGTGASTRRGAEGGARTRTASTSRAP